MNLWINIIGWSAAVIILIAYAMLSLGKVAPRSALYQWLNVVGAGGFIVNGGWNGALPSAVLNVIWMGIGLYALTRRTNVRS